MPRYARVTVVALVEIPDDSKNPSSYVADYINGVMENADVFDWSYPKTNDGEYFLYGETVRVSDGYMHAEDSLLDLQRTGEPWISADHSATEHP